MQVDLTKEELTEIVEAAVEKRVKSLVTTLLLQQTVDRQVGLWVMDRLKDIDIEKLAEQKLSKDLLKGVQEHICGEIASAIADKFYTDDDPWDEI